MNRLALSFIIFFYWQTHFAQEVYNNEKTAYYSLDTYFKHHASPLVRNIGERWLGDLPIQAEIVEIDSLLKENSASRSVDENIALHFYHSKLHVRSNDIIAGYDLLTAVYMDILESDNKFLLVHYYRLLGDLLYRADANKLSNSYLRKAKEEIDLSVLEDYKSIISLESKIASNYSILGNHSEAIAIMTDLSQRYMDKIDSNAQSGLLLELADCYYKADSFEQCYYYLKQSEAFLGEHKQTDLSKWARILKKQANYFLVVEDYDRAAESFAESYRIDQDSVNRYKPNTSVSKLLKLAEIGWIQGDLRRMEKYLILADSLCQHSGEIAIKLNYINKSKELWKLYYDSTNADLAIDKFFEYVKISDVLTSKNDSLYRVVTNDYYSLRASESNSKLELLKAGNRLLLQKRKAARRLAFLTAAIFLVIITALINYFRLQNKMHAVNIQAIEADKKLAQMETQNAKIQEANLRKEIQIKNSELTNLRAANSTKIKTTEVLLDRIDRMLEQKEINIMDFRQFSRDLWLQLNKEKQIATLQKEMVKSDPGFMARLNDLYPSLSKSERELCVYLRLNMSSKDIAQFVERSPNSIVVARHRIRKKLGLERSDELVQFIQSI